MTIELDDTFVLKLCRPLVEAAELAQMGISVSVVDGDVVRRLYVSDVAARILGYTAEELVGRSTFISFPPAEVERLRALSAQWQSGQSVPFFLESVVVGKDGKHIPVEVAYSPVVLDGKPATVAFLRDITDRKRTEEALKKSESLFRKLVEAAPEAVLVSRNDLVVYANPHYVRMLGYQGLDELVGKNTMELIHPDDRELDERRLLRKDGSILSVECSSLAIEFEGASALLTFMRDVTKRREVQAQLIQTDRMATIGTLAATVAHEINNPLAYVMLNLGVFEEELDAVVEAPEARRRIHERLRILREGTAHIATIVRDLRAFCRPNAPPEPIDVRGVLESAINMAMSEMKDRALLVREYSPVRPVLADAARLGQVFLNLLLNAVQALDSDAHRNEVRVVLRPDGGDHVQIRISDSGHGIAPEIVGRIFEPFFTTKPPGFGTGLGLSISQSIVHDMNGHLTVESCAGQGSTFTVRLPATDSVVDNGRKSASTKVRAGRGGRLLIVDDEVALADALDRILRADHEVVAMTSGTGALELLLRGASFDVILCDVVMPGLNGIDFYRELERARPELVQRTIFMTGGEDMAVVADFLSRIGSRWLNKPIDLQRLRHLIDEVTAP